MPRKPAPEPNRLCKRCVKTCKQPASVVLIACPQFEAQPVQLTVPLRFPRGRPRKPRP